MIPVWRSLTTEEGRVVRWVEPPPLIFDLCVLETQLRELDDYSKCCSVLLNWSIEEVEEHLTSKEIFHIVGSALKASRQFVPRTDPTSDGLSEQASVSDLWSLVYTLCFYSKQDLNRLLRLPTPLVLDFARQVQKLVENERDFQVEISAVKALAVAFGGDESTKSSSDQVIDLSDESSIEKLATLGDLPIEVET